MTNTFTKSSHIHMGVRSAKLTALTYVKTVFRRKLRSRVYPAEILLPSHAPPEYSDRRTLWNPVEKAELHPKAQLAYSFDIALQNEFSI